MEAKPSKYTDKDYIILLKELLDERHRAQQEALRLVEIATANRINAEQASKYVSIAEYASYKKDIGGKLDALFEAKNIATGKASQASVYFVGSISLVGLIISIIKMF